MSGLPNGGRTEQGRRVLITGAARGIGAALARRLSAKGDRVAIIGLEPELLEKVAEECGGAPWFPCDVRDRSQVDGAVAAAAEALGGIDVVVANAGVAAQLPMVGGDPSVFEATVAVNVLGTYYTLRAAGEHISHPRGYALAIASLAAAVQAPLLGAYSASKAAVEAMANTLRVELRPSGARVGVGYFAQLDTEMTSRGFGTRAGRALMSQHSFIKVAPLEAGVSALARGIDRRSRIVVAPMWVGAVLPIRMTAQRVVEAATQRGLSEALSIAREESVPLTTPLDGQSGGVDPGQ